MADTQSAAPDVDGMRACLADTTVRYAVLFGSYARSEADATSMSTLQFDFRTI